MNYGGLHIIYENPKEPVEPRTDPYEGYDAESAFYDYLPSGARATIEIDGYRLDLPGMKFVSLVRALLPLAEQLATLPPDSWEQLRPFFPDLTPETRLYHLIIPDFLVWLPVVVFTTDGTTTRIHTRTLAEGGEGLDLIVWEERDRAEPVETTNRAIIEEIRSFLTHYLDDLSAAFPFILDDEIYQEYRLRIKALGDNEADSSSSH